jgi:hypothetical protein
MVVGLGREMVGMIGDGGDGLSMGESESLATINFS